MKSLVKRIERESNMDAIYHTISGKLSCLEELDELTNICTFDEWDDEWQAVVAGELGRDPTPDEFKQLQSLLLSEYLHVIGRA